MLAIFHLREKSIVTVSHRPQRRLWDKAQIQTCCKKTVEMQGDPFPFKEKGKLQDSKEGEKEPKHPTKGKYIAYVMGNTAESFQESQMHSKKRKQHESLSSERSCKHWSDQRKQCFMVACICSRITSPPQTFMPPHPPQQSRLLGGVSGGRIWPNEKIRE